MLALLTSAQAAAAPPFSPGGTCAGVNIAATASSAMLNGKHLHLGEAGEWRPFAFEKAVGVPVERRKGKGNSG